MQQKNGYSRPVLKTIAERRHTPDGRLVVWGSAAQLPPAAICLWMAYLAFPGDRALDLLTASALHLAMPIALAGTFVRRGGQLEFPRSGVLTALLALLVVVPFFLSLPLFSAAN